jgi:hypothetical protein
MMALSPANQLTTFRIDKDKSMDAASVKVFQEMHKLMQRPGLVNMANGGQRLRDLYHDGMCKRIDLIQPVISHRAHENPEQLRKNVCFWDILLSG